VNKAFNHRMNSGDNLYVWQQKSWPEWRYESDLLMPILARVHQALGQLIGRMRDQGLVSQSQASFVALTQDVLKTSEIEGEFLNQESVRSSIARHLGVDIAAVGPADRKVDGVVDMIVDATKDFAKPLTIERLFGWHAALFPTGYSGLTQLGVGRFRDDAMGPMQVVSGSMTKRRVHFEAPPAHTLKIELINFLQWFEGQLAIDPLLKAGLAHLWFVTIHPFDDGNGRIARAIGDMALARADQSTLRFYSLSAQIQKERSEYYDLLERTQKGDLDATDWLRWFLECLERALATADDELTVVLRKARFWQRWSQVPLNERQINLLNTVLDGFEGKLTNKKWSALAKCSSDTALRDIKDLMNKGLLQATGAGRGTSYKIVGN
jgi:Fic family protein